MKPLPTWRYLVEMARYKPLLYLLHAVLWGAFSMSSLLAGLIARAFFDTLTGQVHLPVGTTGLIVLLVVLAVSRVALWLTTGFVEIILRFTMSGLLRRNLLRHVLDGPEAHALPYSIGETISRFRDDAHQAEDNLDWTDEIVGQGLFAVGAFLVLLHINARMTLVAILPLVVVAAVTRRASTALGLYRAASSQATSPLSLTHSRNAKRSAIQSATSGTVNNGRGQQRCEPGAGYPRAISVRGERCLCRVDHADRSDRGAHDGYRKRPNA